MVDGCQDIYIYIYIFGCGCGCGGCCWCCCCCCCCCCCFLILFTFWTCYTTAPTFFHVLKIGFFSRVNGCFRQSNGSSCAFLTETCIFCCGLQQKVRISSNVIIHLKLSLANQKWWSVPTPFRSWGPVTLKRCHALVWLGVQVGNLPKYESHYFVPILEEAENLKLRNNKLFLSFWLVHRLVGKFIPKHSMYGLFTNIWLLFYCQFR